MLKYINIHTHKLEPENQYGIENIDNPENFIPQKNIFDTIS